MYNTNRLRTHCQFYNNLQFVNRYSQLERKRALSSVFDSGHLPQAYGRERISILVLADQLIAASSMHLQIALLRLLLILCDKPRFQLIMDLTVPRQRSAPRAFTDTLN
jgi:hypothetical protein